ncbi:hypothetical protein [Mesorhizobium sp. B2-7-1]|uniref:hypothetical protein n=1 Tax=Mesorhizobium sp. B2-7-1 TaxID=2589909 RepID=UPI001129006E|nr:hypothetical protein [Mesorhizobium sp. B2-7-1]TPJ62781.1 hypothetical protein FJ471_16350 [Mesorhizobium sp. B2-7-1]
MAEHFTLNRCRKEGKLHGLAAGKYLVEYNDTTHLDDNQWIRLAEIDVRSTAVPAGEEDTEQFYTIRKDISGLPKEEIKNDKSGKNADDSSKRNTRALEDALSLSLARAGILSPDITEELFAELVALGTEDGIVVVPDTNALHNGALHWLLKILHRPPIWILPLAASLTTVQQRDAMVKALVGKHNLSNLSKAVRSRGLVNGALGLLIRNRGRSQVVELDHSLLRYQKTASTSGADPDHSDVLEDRLIIEGIHSVLRTMRTRSTRRVITSDVNMARVLEAEGIDTLFVPSISMGATAVECVRYDALARAFIGAPLCATIWELVHTFGSIRLMKGKAEVANLNCFWPSKSPAHWSSETLLCTFDDEATKSKRRGTREQEPLDSTADADRNGRKSNSSEPTDRGPGDRGETALPAESPARMPRNASIDSVRPVAVLPRASLPQALKLLGLVKRLQRATPAQAADASLGTTADTVRRAFDLLRRTDLLEEHAASFSATADADLVDRALKEEDLDAVSLIFQRFEPYAAFLGLLQSLGEMRRAEVFPALQRRFGLIGSEEATRLPRFHSLLGQAWTDGDTIRDGSRRLTDRDATEAFHRAYAATSIDGLSKVIELLPHLCRAQRISPWAAKKQVERFIREGLLPEYRFEPSAGGKPVTRDETISGQLGDIVVKPVVIDRLHIGDRPVFTIGGPSR